MRTITCSECNMHPPEEGGAWCAACSRVFHVFQPAHERALWLIQSSRRKFDYARFGSAEQLK